ncbi:MAG: ABC transporter substrate-binding protein [Actinomycetota bacterium]
MATSTGQAASKPSTKAKYGGDIVVGIADTFPGFCVSSIPNHSALGGFRLMYEQLFERTVAGEYVGALAESGTANATFTEWTIKLRQGITFHNGEVFNADAAKLNIDLNSGLYNAQNTSLPAAFRTPGAGYASTGYGVNANIINVAKVDDYTIRIELNEPQNDFLGVLYRAGRYVMRAPAQLRTAAGAAEPTCQTKPIGTGPYTFVSYNNDTLNVTKNANYWRKHPVNGDKLPYIDNITFINIKEPSQRAAAVRKGTVDAASFDGTAGTFILDLAKRKSLVTMYKAQPLWYGSWVPNINKTGSIFKSKNCRLAVGYAIDWNAYNKVRLKGVGNVSGSIVTKGHPMFNKQNAATYNLTAAKDYVAKCKTDTGKTDVGWALYADTSTASQNNEKFLRKYLNDAGFTMLNPDIKEAALHIVDIYANSFGVTQKTLTQGTPAEGGDSAYVSIFYRSSAFPTGHKSPVAKTAIGAYYNKVIALSNVDDPKIDSLISEAQAATTTAAANAKWREMTAYLQGEGYQLPAVHSSFWTFVNNKSKLRGIGKLPIVKGKTPQVVTNKGLDWAGIWQDK